MTALLEKYRFFWGENVEVAGAAICLCVTGAIFFVYYLLSRRHARESETKTVAKPRFRKRDRLLYYGRKFFRKVPFRTRTISSRSNGSDVPQTPPPSPTESKHIIANTKKTRRQDILKLARSLLNMKRLEDKQLLQKEPPAALLEADLSIKGEMDLGLPTEFVYMLRNVRVFGHIDKPMYMDLCKHIEVMFIMAGQTLFTIGDPDDSIYVVQEGQIDVFIREGDGTDTIIKEVFAGDSIHSLLSILDIIAGHPNILKTVSARAEKDSTVLKLPASSFEQSFNKYPESLVRIVQVIMVRIQRVTFTALHDYLGLDQELINPKPEFDLKLGLSFKDEDEDPATWQTSQSKIKEQEELKLVQENMAKILGLEKLELLNGKLHLRRLKGGVVICNQGDPDAYLILVVKGCLQVSQKVVGHEAKETVVFMAQPGELVGIMAVLSGEPSIFSVRAKSDTKVCTITKADFYSIMQQVPSIVLNIAHMVVKRLSPFVRQIDFALDWQLIDSGRAVYRQDDQSDYIYIILNGRLRTIVAHHNGKKEVAGEFGRGELVGIVEVLTNTKRATTALAVRDTELAKVPRDLLEYIKRKYPQVVTRLIRLLGHRLLGQVRTRSPSLLADSSRGTSVDGHSALANLSTVAIVPASDSVPLTPFTLELQYALSEIGPSLRLTSDIITSKLGNWALDSVNDYRLSSWLSAQEDLNRIVLYQCDPRFTPWTQRCIRQSDLILVVALHEEVPAVGKLERNLETMGIRSQKELILLHRANGPKPKNTVDWLNAREWCITHYHIRCPSRVFTSMSGERLLRMYESVMANKPDPMSDFSRLARFVTGTAIGVVLGGGGARGAAQVGMIKAMTEAGIPIDMVGGTSIGSLVGALWAEERTTSGLIQRARRIFYSLNSRWKSVLDLTYPITSMLTGAAFNKSIHDTFGDTQIEDLWIPHFIVTTDITASKMRVHTHGSLWRYVRSSMSLAGYLPPLCDPKDGHLLLDGGYVNNVPADVMKSLGAGMIFAIDVGAIDDKKYTNYGDDLSGWWLMMKRWNPWAKPVRVPNMEEIQSALAYISCERLLEEIQQSTYCSYSRPPVDKYATLQFGSFDEIYEVGYNHGKPYFEGIVKSQKAQEKESLNRQSSHASGHIHPHLHRHSSHLHPHLHRAPSSPRGGSHGSQESSWGHVTSGNMQTTSFTDLAELVSQIKNPRSFDITDALNELIRGSDDEEDEEESASDSGAGTP